jgi:hypothetical protein
MMHGFVDLTLAGWIHTIRSTVGIVVGAEQLIHTRRDRLRRRPGSVQGLAMFIADGAILSVRRFDGCLHVFHVGAIADVVMIALAIRSMRGHARAGSWTPHVVPLAPCSRTAASPRSSAASRRASSAA